MRVGVEEAEPEDLPEEDHRPPTGDVGRLGRPSARSPARSFTATPPISSIARTRAVEYSRIRLGDVGVPLAGELAAAALHGPEFDREVEFALRRVRSNSRTSPTGPY